MSLCDWKNRPPEPEEEPVVVNGRTYTSVAHSDDTDFEAKVKELLLFHKVVKAEVIDAQSGVLTLDNGTQLYLEGNGGGPGSDGWFYLEALNKCDNVITNVECVLDDTEAYRYHIYVFAGGLKVNLTEYEGSDNEYYGTGYNLYVSLAKP